MGLGLQDNEWGIWDGYKVLGSRKGAWARNRMLGLGGDRMLRT